MRERLRKLSVRLRENGQSALHSHAILSYRLGILDSFGIFCGTGTGSYNYFQELLTTGAYKTYLDTPRVPPSLRRRIEQLNYAG